MARAGNSRSGPPAHATDHPCEPQHQRPLHGMVPGPDRRLYARKPAAIDLRRALRTAVYELRLRRDSRPDLDRAGLQLGGTPPLRWDRLSLGVWAVEPALPPGALRRRGRGTAVAGGLSAIQAVGALCWLCTPRFQLRPRCGTGGGRPAGCGPRPAQRSARVGRLAIEPRPRACSCLSGSEKPARKGCCPPRASASEPRARNPAGARHGSGQPDLAWRRLSGHRTGSGPRVRRIQALHGGGQTAIFASATAAGSTAPRPPSGMCGGARRTRAARTICAAA